MIQTLKHLCVVMTLLFVTGCAVRFPQVEAMLAATAEPVDPLADHRYEVTIGDVTIATIAIDLGGMTAFANDNDQAIFVEDGQVLRAIGFEDALRSSSTIYLALGPATKREENQPWKALCAESIAVSELSMVKHCELNGQKFSSDVELNRGGSIVRLTQVIDNTGRTIVIKKKN